jgi:hypothetical protein
MNELIAHLGAIFAADESTFPESDLWTRRTRAQHARRT